MVMLQIKITQDGSPTIYNSYVNAYYHSIYGALQESRYVYIEQGFLPILNIKEKIKILEIGFGTGLNCFLTYKEWKKYTITFNLLKDIEYIGIEKYPLDNSIIERMKNYPPFDEDMNLFLELHYSKNNWIKLDNHFSLKVIHEDVVCISNKELNNIDVVYYDAFAPAVQHEMWERNIFEVLYQKMNNNAVLTTFCAQGDFKRKLKSIGFVVESLKGAAGKREMTRAIKT